MGLDKKLAEAGVRTEDLVVDLLHVEVASRNVINFWRHPDADGHDPEAHRKMNRLICELEKALGPYKPA